MKIRPVGAKLFQAGRRKGRTDMTKLVVTFRNFANASKKILSVPYFLNLHTLLRFFVSPWEVHSRRQRWRIRQFQICDIPFLQITFRCSFKTFLGHNVAILLQSMTRYVLIREIYKIHHKTLQQHSPKNRVRNTEYNWKITLHKTKPQWGKMWQMQSIPTNLPGLQYEMHRADR